MDALIKNIHWLGHDSFRIDGSKTVYFDPFEIRGGPPADIIFVTHEHFDHCSPDDIAKIRTDQTIIVTEKAAAGKLGGEVRVMKPGDDTVAAGLAVRAIAAYNTNKTFHPKANGWLGFVVTIDGVSIYHAGDTDHIPEMSGLAPDIALLPVSGTYVMTADEAVAAAVAINPRLAIPMHYGGIVGNQADALAFESGLASRVPVAILTRE